MAPLPPHRPGEAGFVTLEAIAAFAMLCAVLGTAILATSQALEGGRWAAAARAALAVAENSLAALGTVEPLVPGEREGVSETGDRWRTTVDRFTASDGGAWVAVAVWPASENGATTAPPLLTLRTFKRLRVPSP